MREYEQLGTQSAKGGSSVYERQSAGRASGTSRNFLSNDGTRERFIPRNRLHLLTGDEPPERNVPRGTYLDILA
jgi:hypothetical protein